MVNHHNERKLKRHIGAASTTALAAGLGLAVSTDTQAVVIPVNDYDNSPLPTLDVDIGLDGSVDLSFFAKDFELSGCSGYDCVTGTDLFAAGPNGGVVGSYTDRVMASLLADGVEIGSGSVFYGSGLVASTDGSGGWLPTQSGFLGFRFEIGGVNHFGWASITTDSTGVAGVLNTLAYEQCPGASILAGDSVGQSCDATKSSTSVPAPGSLALLAIGALPLLRHRARQARATA